MRKPNILLLMSDEHRGDWLGLHGAQGVRTPHIDALARRGRVFTQAICASPLCAPSRATFATGYSYDRSAVKTNAQDLPATAPTLYRDLRRAGYHVSTFGKLDLLKGSASWGSDGRHRTESGSKLWDMGFDAGCDCGGKHEALHAFRSGKPEPYTHYLSGLGLAEAHSADYARRGLASAGTISPRSEGHDVYFLDTTPTELPEEAYCDNWIGRSAFDLVPRASSGRPWFLQVNFCGPHEPMDVTRAMWDRWRETHFPLPDEMSGLSPEHHQDIRRNYAAMIETVDGWVGRFVALLEASGQNDETIVIYTSDHGEMLGERGMWEKHVPWHPSVHVPLVIAGGAFAGGGRDPRAVSLLDLTATLRAAAGVEPPEAASGSALDATDAGADRTGRIVTAGLGNWRLAFDGRYKLVIGYDPAVPRRAIPPAPFGIDGPMALYDLDDDPGERRDISAARPDIVAKLRHHIEAAAGAAP